MGELWIRKDVVVDEPAQFIDWYLEHVGSGRSYYGRPDVTTGAEDTVGLADLGWTVLLGAGPRWRAARSLVDAGPIDISAVPTTPLHDTNHDERERIVDALMELVRLPGFRSSIASKALHPKRRRSVPILDNEAIFGSFCLPGWRPGQPCRAVSVDQRPTIAAGLQAICDSVSSGQDAWAELERRTWEAPDDRRTLRFFRIELFDMTWWTVLKAPELEVEEAGSFLRCSLP
jgi:hypothetical protein